MLFVKVIVCFRRRRCVTKRMRMSYLKMMSPELWLLPPPLYPPELPELLLLLPPEYDEELLLLLPELEESTASVPELPELLREGAEY